MKQQTPGIKFMYMEFQDSHQELLYDLHRDFKCKVNTLEYDYRTSSRFNLIWNEVKFEMNYGKLKDHYFYRKPEAISSFINELTKLLQESLKVCPGTFYENPKHCADDYLKKSCKTIFKKIAVQNDFEKESVDKS